MVQICPLAFSCPVFSFIMIFILPISLFILFSLIQFPDIGKHYISLFPYPTLIYIYWVSHYYSLSFSPEFSSWLRMGLSTRFLDICSLFFLSLPKISELVSNPVCQDDSRQWLSRATSQEGPLWLLHFPALAPA